MGRLFRLLRFLRLTRINRVMRHFSSLRLVVFSVLDSMNHSLWCFIIIFTIIYIFAIFSMTATAEHATDHLWDDEEVLVLRRDLLIVYLFAVFLMSASAEHRQVYKEGDELNVLHDFGSLFKSMVTLFKVITG
mmetsp:Transcript_102279/g.327944  ORF Transcript_102279/g.327944 Transcript_102279/m.327944 type:complete len:133 (+) Transcript_102279:417-815(+)